MAVGGSGRGLSARASGVFGHRLQSRIKQPQSVLRSEKRTWLFSSCELRARSYARDSRLSAQWIMCGGKSTVRLPQGLQSPGYITFSLDKDLESLAHAFRVDQRLELQPRFRTLRVTLAFIVQVREFILLPQREEKCCL